MSGRKLVELGQVGLVGRFEQTDRPKCNVSMKSVQTNTDIINKFWLCVIKRDCLKTHRRWRIKCSRGQPLPIDKEQSGVSS